MLPPSPAGPLRIDKDSQAPTRYQYLNTLHFSGDGALAEVQQAYDAEAAPRGKRQRNAPSSVTGAE
jgi:hypothetical protein